MKRCSVSLVIREMQIKTTMSYEFSSARMSVLKKRRKQMLARVWQVGNPCVLLVGMWTGEATKEITMEFPQEIKNRTTSYPINPTPGYISKEKWNRYLKRISVLLLFVAALFTIDSIQKSPMGLSVNEWVKKTHTYIPLYIVHCVYGMGYIQWNIIQSFKRRISCHLQ